MTTENVVLSASVIEIIAGLSAGTAATLVVHPLDVLKTRLQVNREPSTVVSGRASNAASNVVAGSPTSPSILRTLLSRDQPLRSLYRGLTPNLLGNASSWALFFYFKHACEASLQHVHGLREQRLDASSDGDESASANGTRVSGGPCASKYAPAAPPPLLTPLDYFIASFAGGILTTLATNPLWVIKTRMLSTDRSARGAYTSIGHGARQIWRVEGAAGFYKGVGISMLGTVHGAVQFGVYEPLKRAWRGYARRGYARRGYARRGYARRCGAVEEEAGWKGSKGTDGDHEKIGIVPTLFLSATAKIIAGTTTYPYQVVRSRLQTHDAEQRFGRGITGVVSRVWREEGWRGFYRGVGVNVVRVLPATWVTFLVYENVRYHLPLRVNG